MKNSTKRKRRRARGISPWPTHFKTFFALLGYTELYKFDKHEGRWIQLSFFSGRYYPHGIYFVYRTGDVSKFGVPIECDLKTPGFFSYNGKITPPPI